MNDGHVLLVSSLIIPTFQPLPDPFGDTVLSKVLPGFSGSMVLDRFWRNIIRFRHTNTPFPAYGCTTQLGFHACHEAWRRDRDGTILTIHFSRVGRLLQGSIPHYVLTLEDLETFPPEFIKAYFGHPSQHPYILANAKNVRDKVEAVLRARMQIAA